MHKIFSWNLFSSHFILAEGLLEGPSLDYANCRTVHVNSHSPVPQCIMQVIESKYDSSWNKGSPSTKVLVFTDFLPTISNFLKNERGGRLGQAQVTLAGD